MSSRDAHPAGFRCLPAPPSPESVCVGVGVLNQAWRSRLMSKTCWMCVPPGLDTRGLKCKKSDIHPPRCPCLNIRQFYFHSFTPVNVSSSCQSLHCSYMTVSVWEVGPGEIPLSLSSTFYSSIQCVLVMNVAPPGGQKGNGRTSVLLHACFLQLCVVSLQLR